MKPDTLKIEMEFRDWGRFAYWLAVEANSYDGPGSEIDGPGSPVGVGDTEQEAIDSLMEKLEERK